MKIILSRKGFDSQNGKLPNLILPDAKSNKNWQVNETLTIQDCDLADSGNKQMTVICEGMN